jgi:hypothetical protein
MAAFDAPELQPLARQHLKRNFNLGVLNGALFAFGDALQDANLVMSVFIYRLTGSSVLVGLLQPVRLGGWYLPQLFVSGRMQGARRKLPYYQLGTLFRATASIGVGLSVLLVHDPRVLVPLVFLLLATFSLSGGLSGIAYADLVAKTIPPRRRGSFAAWRIFTGGLLALAGSFVVRYLIGGGHGIAFPANFGLLLLLGSFGIASGMAAFVFIIEPPDTSVPPRVSIPAQLSRSGALLRRNSDYRYFLLARILLMLSEVAAPFYIIYGKLTLGLPDSIAGTYLMVGTAANILSTSTWGRISDGIGNRTVLLLVCLLGVLGPLAALGTGPLLALLGHGSWLPPVLFAAVFALLGAARTGLDAGGFNFLLDLAPHDDRPLYIGLTNTVVGLATLITAAGGLFVQLAGYRALFALAALFYLVAGGCVMRTREPRRRLYQDADHD